MDLISRGYSVPATPEPLNRIRYVRVEYKNWRNPSDQGILDYDGSVSWSAVNNCWEMYIDYNSFLDVMIEKKSISFLDANKTPVSMQGFTYIVNDAEGDPWAGRIWIRKA